MARTVDKFGRLDVLVNNAGFGHAALIEDVTVESFDRMVAVNLRAVVLATQEALPHMDEGGRIISIGSIFADRVPLPGQTPYALTKAAIGGFTRTLARELGGSGCLRRGQSRDLEFPGAGHYLAEERPADLTRDCTSSSAESRSAAD